MNYHNISMDDMVNGEGVRTVLWLSGCPHQCKGCHNPQTWDKNSGIPFDEKAKQELFNNLSQDYIRGLTLSGGDPLGDEEKILELTQLCKEIKEKFPNKTIWLYTGFPWSWIKQLEILKYCDVVCDGRYEEELRSFSTKYVGSTNQKIIDVQKSLKTGECELYEWNY